ncbi:hypothetical protein ACQWHJ_24525, partial [Salmonella enterica subsp. enterica serovar Infantis]
APCFLRPCWGLLWGCLRFCLLWWFSAGGRFGSGANWLFGFFFGGFLVLTPGCFVFFVGVFLCGVLFFDHFFYVPESNGISYDL